MKTWTINEMLAEDPCDQYDRARVTELWAGRARLSLREILDLPIPADHRMWVACRPSALTEAARATVIKRIVTRAVTEHALHCGVASVEQWATRWLDRSAARAASAAWAAAASAWAAGAAGGARAAEYTRQVEDVRAELGTLEVTI